MMKIGVMLFKIKWESRTPAHGRLALEIESQYFVRRERPRVEPEIVHRSLEG
jgi:hypothetical protein